MTLGLLPLTDPLITAQSLLAGHRPAGAALLGSVIVVVFYFIVGGRVYCSWVCPMNMVTDTAAWLRGRIGLPEGRPLSPYVRYGLLAGIMLVALLTGTVAWEFLNPVSMLHRGLFFGMGMAWMAVASVFLLDLLVSPRAWCGHICPMGAFYGLLGFFSIPRVSAAGRHRCTDCGDCFSACPEPQVIAPVLGPDASENPLVLSPNCTNCGRCVDVCSRDVFRFTNRFYRSRRNFNRKTEGVL